MITPRELQILDLSDRGFRAGQIAVQLDLKPQGVVNVINRLGNQVIYNDQTRFEQSILAGSQALLGAIQHARAA